MPYLIVEKKVPGKEPTLVGRTYLLSVHTLDHLYSQHIDAEMVREFKRCKKMIVNYLDFQMLYTLKMRGL